MTTLLNSSREELMGLLQSGFAIDPAALDDSEYRGISLGLPSFVEKLTWKKFKKVFHRDPRSAVLRGWNVRVEQDELDAPCRARTKRGAPVTFGHYQVVQANEREVPAGCGRGLLIDYGRGGNSGVMARLRDPIVALKQGDSSLLLGWSFLDLGFRQVPTPSFFALEREGRLSQPVAQPRG
jgi:hypothetical protein